MEKRFTYKIMLVALLQVLSMSIYAQNRRDDFKRTLNQAFELIKKNPEEAIRKASASYDIAKDSNDQWATAMALSGIGYVGYKLRDYESAYVNYSDALEAFQNADTVDLYNEFNVLRHLAMIHSKYNNYDESIEFRIEATKVAKRYLSNHPDHAKEYGKERILEDVQYYMAVEYTKKGAHRTAGKILMDLWESAEDKEDIAIHAKVLNRLGLIKKKNGEYSAAQEYFGLVVAEKDVAKSHKAMAYHNLAETYMIQGDYGKAESFYLNALDFKQEIGNARSTFITYQGLGELAYRKGNMLEAIKDWETGLSIFDKVESEPELYSIYNWLQLAYMDLDVEKAKTFNQTYAQLNDFYVRNQSLQREDDADNREALSMLIDKQRQKRIDAAQRQQFIRQFWPVFLGVALLVLFSMVLGVRYYMALKANKLLTQSQLKMQEAQASSNASEVTED